MSTVAESNADQELASVQSEYATYLANRIRRREGIKLDRKADLDVELDIIRKEARIGREEKIATVRREAKIDLAEKIKKARLDEANARREVLKVLDSETNSELGKMRTRMGRLIVEANKEKVEATGSLF